MSNLFQSLNQDEKIEFFVKCQELMLKHHQKSPFIVREKSLGKVLDSFVNNIQKYQGYSYADDNICVLWNKIYVSDPSNVNLVVRECAYQPPNPVFNGVSIDFAVFRRMEDCLAFVKSNYQPQIRYVLFIREGKPKIYETEAILKSMNKS